MSLPSFLSNLVVIAAETRILLLSAVALTKLSTCWSSLSKVLTLLYIIDFLSMSIAFFYPLDQICWSLCY